MSVATAQAPDGTLRIGVLAPEGAEEAHANWTTLSAHLAAALPEYGITLTSFDLPGLRAAVERSQLDFFIANSGFYVETEFAFGAARIATLESPEATSPGRGIASAVIVRADRHDLQAFSDLRGQRLMAVGERAFGGFQIAWREMRRSGFDPRRDASSLVFAGFPLTRIVDAVLRGEADAGVIRACLLERLITRGEVPAGALRVINLQPEAGYPCQRSTPLYPDWPFAALRTTPHPLSKRVATALLTMPAAPGNISWTVPTDYQPVHELFRELEIGPYAHRAAPSLLDWLQAHKWAVALVLALLAGWVAHTLRVEVLVTRRTRELREALQARDRAEAAASEREQQLEHLSRLGILGEMASMLAHELTQPLAAIANFARGMQLRIAAGRNEPDSLLEGAQAIEGQADRAALVMERIRAFSMKRAIARVPFDVGELVEQSIAMFLGMAARGAEVRLERSPRTNAPLIVAGDALQLQQVMLNLLKNAFDATRELLPAHRVIVVRLGADANRVRIDVLDRGPPVAPENAARLFEPFFTTKPDGVGLGLAICQRTVEAHGGHIRATPRTTGGLCVTIMLPANEPDEYERSAPPVQ